MSKISENAIKCFSTSIHEIMNETGFHEATVDLISTEVDYSVLVTIGLTGDVSGYLMLESDLNSANNFVKILAEYVGMEDIENDFGDFHKSTFSEIVNQICGRTTIHLSEIDLDCNITPPSIIVGSSIFASISDFDTTETFYIKDHFGQFKVFIGINIS
ncbi:MAG: chemotaxis protein CheX [Spirochaetaceae bacterium]